MKSRASALRWLIVPLGAAAGYYTGFARQDHTASVSSGTSGSPAAEAPNSSASPAPGSVTSWAERLRTLSAGELPAVYAEIMALPESNRDKQRLALRLLCARWAEIDPPGGVAFFTKTVEDEKDPRKKDSWGRIWVLTEWALRDNAAAYEFILTMPEKERDGELLNVGSELLREDPKGFWAWFQKARVPLPTPGSDHAFWREVADAHFDELAAIAKELADAEPVNKDQPWNPSKVEGMYAVLAASLAGRDQDRAVAWAREQPEKLRNRALAGALRVIAEKSPERVTEFLPLLKSKQVGANYFHGSGADEILKTAVKGIAARDPVQALEWMDANSGKMGDDSHSALGELQTQFATAMRENRLTAQQAVTALQSIKGDDNLKLNMALSMWRDLPADKLAAAAEGMRGADSKGVRDWVLQGIFPEWVKQDRAAAMAFAGSLEDKRLATEMFESVARGTLSGSADGLGDRVAATLRETPPEYRAGILSGHLRMYNNEHMMDGYPPMEGRVLAEALEGLPPSESLDKATQLLAEVWGTADPHAALTWAAARTDPASREKSVGVAVESWAKQDAWGASQWIDSQPRGEIRDTAAHHLARVLREDEPESAWVWASGIGDAATRLEAQAAVLRKWRDSSAPEALAAVDRIADSLAPADLGRLTDTLQHRDAAK